MSFLGTLGSIVNAVGNVATGGLLGKVETAIGSVIPHNTLVATQGASPVTPLTTATVLPSVPQLTPGAVPVPGLGGAVSRLLPGGQTGYETAYGKQHINKKYAAWYRATQAGKQVKDPTKAAQVVNVVVNRRRKFNVMNGKALMRASARIEHSVHAMRRALKHTKYQLMTRGHHPGRGRTRARR